MTANKIIKKYVFGFLMLVFSIAAAFAQIPPPPEGTPPPPPPDVIQQTFTQAELDQMLAPIALYPDALLSQILMAATYPLEVVEAARWSRANPNLKGDEAVSAVAQNNWDPSVKSLVAFPQIIQMMDQKLDWTERLGDAFLSQQAQVMDTIQNLRRRAYDAGNLDSTGQIYVEPEGQNIVLEPANPYVIYVPYYYPTAIYGPWWWPAYPPVYWAPWPGYYVGPVITAGFFFGFGVPVPPHFFFGACDWHDHRVNVLQVKNHYFNYDTYANRQRAIYPVVNVTNTGVAWGHDPVHRRGVPYRTPALRQQFSRVSVASETRRDFRGYVPPSTTAPAVQQLAPATRPSVVQSRKQPEAQRGKIVAGSTVAKPATIATPGRPNMPPPSSVQPFRATARPAVPIAQPRPNAFEYIDRGAQVRDYSARGRESFQAAMPRTGAPPAPPAGRAPAARAPGNAPAQQPAGSAGGTMRH
ncbi:MAG TPA: DUF3300 domain-containing protein [Burkholderiales bacterium]|nr:DUF3300 domain-containing protein [Burkholderiales bacterium]